MRVNCSEYPNNQLNSPYNQEMIANVGIVKIEL